MEKFSGGVTSKEISEELKKQSNLEIDKKQIILKETIKSLGRFSLDVKFKEGLSSKININIISE